MNRLAIIVLNWNSADDTMRCTNSLLAQQGATPDIIVVDNDSHDDSLEQLEKYMSSHSDGRLFLIKNPTNGGYSGGNNTGFAFALEQGYDYIGTLNPDAIADQNWAGSLIKELAAHEQAGIVTGLMLQSNKRKIDTSGEFYTTWGIPGPRLRDANTAKAPSQPEYVFGTTGGGFIARKDMLRTVGLFDEKFFMYFEDVDLCFRAQLAGYKVRYTPSAVAYHKISVSTNKVPGLAIHNTFKNLPILFIKNVPLGLIPTILPRFTLAYVLILGNAIVHGKGKYALSGCLKTFILIPHALRERKHIQSSRKVSNEYISSVILHDIPPEQTGLRKFRKFFTGKA